jgi:membrane protein YdbS with pleckstrin-like domain
MTSNQPPKAPWYIWALTSFAGGWGLQVFAVVIGVAVGLLTGSPLAGAVIGILSALILTQVVLPIAFRRSGWTWGITARRRR